VPQNADDSSFSWPQWPQTRRTDAPPFGIDPAVEATAGPGAVALPERADREDRRAA
jgi:hypothetical protein